MPLHCNKERKAGLFKVFYKTFFPLLVFGLTVSSVSRAQVSTVPVDLTLSTAKYTQCNTLLIQIQVATDKAFTNIVDQSSWTACQPNTNFTYSAVLPPLQGNFYWRGRHQNACTGVISAWSSPFRFYLLLDPSKLVAGDVNADGYLNLVDVIYLVEYFFQGGSHPLHCRSEMSIVMVNALWAT